MAIVEHSVGTVHGREPGGASREHGEGGAGDLERAEERGARRRPGWWGRVREVLEHGGPGYLQFAITNRCNARCEFCGFAVDRLDRASHRSVTLEEARRAIDIALRNRIGYLLFVGGEPLLHRDLTGMVRHAAELGIRPMICTNGSLWTEAMMRELAAGGLRSVVMSVDAADAARHEGHRGLPGVCAKIRRANEVFGELGVQTTASVTASRLVEDYRALPGFLRSLGFESCTFSYPLTSLGSSYLGYSDSGLVTYAKEELVGVFERILDLKKAGPFPVVNPSESLREMQRHARGEPERFGCLGGHKYFYLDWNLRVYRCHNWAEPMCEVEAWEPSKNVRDGCTRCMMDCYRDASVMQRVAVSASDAWGHLKRGRWVAATREIWDRRNWDSLRAVWENGRWIRGL